MPEIKNTFTQGKMNRDLDERIVPNGQYRNALNIQVSTSEDSDVGTVQNILGNTEITLALPDNGSSWECVGSIADEKNDVLYSFITDDVNSAIVEYAKDETVTPVLVDIGNNILQFSTSDIITGINVIDEFLLWTDGTNEPKKINIQRCKDGTTDLSTHTKLIVDGERVFEKEIQTTTTNAGGPNTGIANPTIVLDDVSGLEVGDQFISLGQSGSGIWNFITSPTAGSELYYIIDITGSTVTLSGTFFANGTWDAGDPATFHHQVNISEKHITVIKKKPLRPLSVKINPADPSNKKPLFEKIFPRFSYRYRYEDGEYSAFAPFTDVVFNSEYSYDQNGVSYYDENTAYDTKEPYNSGMRNMIESIELSDFVSPNMPEDVVQVDLLYKQENSNVIYLIDIVKNEDTEWTQPGFNNLSAYKGKFIVNDENIYAALPENQLLRPWDNVPKTALAQEVTGNRVVYGNYTQSYDLGTTPKVVSDYKLRYGPFSPHEEYTWGANLLTNSGFASGTSNWAVSNSITYSSNNQNLVFSGGLGHGISQAFTGFSVGERYRITFNVSGTVSGKLLIRLNDGSGNMLSFGNHTPTLGENVLEGTLAISAPNYITDKFRLTAETASAFTGTIDDVRVYRGTGKDYKTFSDGGFKSVKSQRNYQLGVVYGDKYGRETPVFTSTESSVVIPWEDSSLSNKPLASCSLLLKTHLSSPHPSWANYYKFFVKETSGEYYNLVMDAMYNPTKEDLEKDEHVWLSFSSSDRNKLSKEDYIILKKKVVPDTSSVSLQIEEENKFKILDVKNEAPDAIKYRYLKVGEVANDVGDATGILNSGYSATSGLFHDQNHRPLHPASNNASPSGSYPSGNTIWINKKCWSSIGGGRLVEGSDTNNGNQKVLENLYFSFTRVNVAGGNQSSQKKYKIVSVEVEGTTYPYYVVKLSQSITKDDNNLIKHDPTNPNNRNLHKDVVVKIEKKLSKDLEAFSGRFFVKILSNNLIKSKIESTSLLDVMQNYILENTEHAFWHTDTITTTYDIEAGLINNNGGGGVPSSNNPTGVTGHSGDPITATQSDWDALLTSMGSKRWFIDNMYMVAEQTGEYARHATYGWNGGDTNVPGDIFHGSALGGYTPMSTDSSTMQVPVDVIPQNPTNNTYGDNLINGLEGVVTTTSMHIDPDPNVGLRRWKYIGWNGSGTSSVITNVYNNVGKHVIHISFLAPGEDLHDGKFQGGSIADTDLDLWREDQSNNQTYRDDWIYNNLQGIFGGGVFTSGTGTWNSGNPKHVLMEISGGGPGIVGITNYNVRGYGFGTGQASHENKHNTQWDLPQADQAFANNLQVDKKFRFKDDSDGTIYTIKRSNYSNPKKIYNHTPWRKTWKVDSGGNLVGMGNSVEEAATAWADGTGVNGDGNPTGAQALRDKLEEFGNANNRRLVYILELDKDPTQQTYNPVSGSTNMDSINPDIIEFVTEDFELNAGEVSQNPAIWETEPKDSVDLDIYYEATQAYPITLTEENRELFAPVGCRVKMSGTPSVATNNPNSIGSPFTVDFSSENYLNQWVTADITTGTGNIAYINTGVTATNDNGQNLSFHGIRMKFIREDGSYTTGIIVDDATAVATFTTAGERREFQIIPETGGSHGLSWYNCFSFGNGVESDRIRDDFNGMTIANGVRANATLDKPYVEEHRKSGLIYSGIYNSKNGVNNLNQFIMAEKITKDLNPTFGSIQKLFSRRISLIAFCEDRVVGITANKNALYNADGNPQLVATNAVLGDANPFVGDYGISQNPESFAKESYRAYFTDRQRGAVLRLSMDGLTPISEAGMSDWFKDEFKDTDHFNIIGSYDNYKKNYNLTFDRGGKTYGEQGNSTGLSQTVSFSEDVKGWTSFKSFIPESGVSMSGDYYTFYNGKCWKHHANESRNSFYGESVKPSTIKFLLNESPLAIKNYNTLNYDGDESWSCNSIETDLQEGSVQSFIEKEGKWFNYISGSEIEDPQAFNFQGIGIANGIDNI